MVQTIRRYLIDQCISNNLIYYEDVAIEIGKFLGRSLNLGVNIDNQILSKVLGDISSLEYENDRPLLSSTVIYKNKPEHGYGFYRVCELLNIGKASKLKNKEFGFEELNRCKLFWQNKENYTKYYYSDVICQYNELNSPPMFNIEEIDFFAKWCNKTYDPNNIDHVNAKNFLYNTVWAKTKYWSDEIKKRLPGFDVSNKRYWSKLSRNEGKTVSAFKEYTWAKIFRDRDKDKDIFFSIGLNPLTKHLGYRLDFSWDRKTSNLTLEQQEICRANIPSNLNGNIHIDNIENFNWDNLIKIVVDFISESVHHYDHLINIVWMNKTPQDVFGNYLTKREYPKGGIEALPKLSPKFEVYSPIDFLKQSIDNKELGNIGEELVLEYERNRLKTKGLHKKASEVKITNDGTSYDILSFDDNGNEIYIEVKTTRDNEKTPFYVSINEYLFCKQYKDRSFIYRLYNYDDENNKADFFIIDQPCEKLLFQPTNYKVYLKNNK